MKSGPIKWTIIYSDVVFKSNEIAVAAYEIPWYQYPLCEKNAIMFMLARSQRSADLTAGKYVVLSLQNFTSVSSSLC